MFKKFIAHENFQFYSSYLLIHDSVNSHPQLTHSELTCNCPNSTYTSISTERKIF